MLARINSLCTVGLLGGAFSIAVMFLTGCSGRPPISPELTPPGGNKVALDQNLFNFVPVSRMKVLPSPVLTPNPEISRELRHYRTRDTRFVPLAMERYREFGGTVERILGDEGLPREMTAVALIESAFRPDARSRAGAVGMWQFMKGTALVYGLRVSWMEDERKDVILSTLAAARHLRDLYTAYNDWPLALAAYNAGSASVDRAVLRGKSRDFWTLARKGLFRSETERYVPKVLAGIVLMEEYRTKKL